MIRKALFGTSDLQARRPWPYTLNAGQKPYRYNSEAAAFAGLVALMTSCKRLEVGVMQVSLRWRRIRDEHPDALFALANNVRIALDILTEALASALNNLALGIGRYQAWKAARARRYGRRVLAIYHHLKALEVY